MSVPYWRCAKDNRGRCTFRRSDDAHRLTCLSASAATSGGFAGRSCRGTVAACAVEGSDPRGTGARFGRGAVRVFTRSPPAPSWGRFPSNYPCGEGQSADRDGNLGILSLTSWPAPVERPRFGRRTGAPPLPSCLQEPSCK